MTKHPERLGQQVGEYRLLRQLGRGSFGAVYLAEHLHDYSQAAIKLLQLQLTSREDLKNFLNEARTMMRLRHLHIVPLLDFGLTNDDTPYLVMEYAEKGTLRQYHPKSTKLSLEAVDAYITQLASALQHAHDRRIVHRDVKPENILLRADGTILLSDFGIAKVLEHNSFISLQTQVGTPAYMPPEQSQGKPCPASDQYALAVIVYEWLAGRLPFQGAPLEVMLQHRVDEPPSLRPLRPEMPIQVEQVVSRALAKLPEERFSSIQEFAETLHTTLQKFSSTSQIIQPSDQFPAISPNIVSSPLPSPPLSSQIAPPVAPRKPHSGLSYPPEIPPANDKTRVSSPPQFTHSAEIQATSDRQKMQVPLQSPLLGNQLPITQGLRTLPLQPVSTNPVARPPHPHNKRSTKLTFLITLLGSLLLISLVGYAYSTFMQLTGGIMLPNLQNHNTPVISQKTTHTPSSISQPQALSLGCPDVEASTDHMVADGQTSYQTTIQAKDQTGNQGNVCSDIALERPMVSDGIICKIWLTKAQDLGDPSSDASQLQHIDQLNNPSPNEIQPGLLFDPTTPQVQLCKQGRGTWKFTISPTVSPGDYYIVGLTDWQGIQYNWSWYPFQVLPGA